MAEQSRLGSDIVAHQLEPYVLDLEVNGLAVVPPEVHGVSPALMDQMLDVLLSTAAQMVGCAFELDNGPAAEVEFGEQRESLSAMNRESGKQSQFLIQQLASKHRLFRDLAVNPVAVALIRHMIGHTATRFSSHNAFVKWQGEFGYGKRLGMHCDQTAVPLPWGRTALTANTNWCLTDYTLEGGCLAYVPGSHRRLTHPVFPDAVSRAVPVEAPRGSMIIFHGATWHGAYPRKAPGMRVSVANYYRHAMITSQEDIQGSFDPALADDCADPTLFRLLAGFDDVFPYKQQNNPVPKAKFS